MGRNGTADNISTYATSTECEKQKHHKKLYRCKIHKLEDLKNPAEYFQTDKFASKII